MVFIFLIALFIHLLLFFFGGGECGGFQVVQGSFCVWSHETCSDYYKWVDFASLCFDCVDNKIKFNLSRFVHVGRTLNSLIL